MPENGGMGLRGASKPQKMRAKTRKFTRKKVLKMLAVMEPQQSTGEPVNSHSQEFLTSGRTGRRNALPDILGEHAVVSSADLPARLEMLTTTDGAGTSGTGKDGEKPGTSKQGEVGKQQVNS